MTNPIRLALVTRRFPPLIGGAEKLLSYLADALAVEGADVTVLTSRLNEAKSPAPAGRQVNAALAARPIDHVSSGSPTVVQLNTLRLRFLGTWLYMRNLRRWFQANPIDLAYVSMLKHDAYTVVGTGKRLGFPVVLRPEGAGETGDLAWQSWGNFGRWIGLRCRQADAFVAISQSIEDELRQAWDVGTMRDSWLGEWINRTPTSLRITAIPNGVPVPEIAWQRRPEWRKIPRAIFIGRLASEKGLDTLINAWPIVRARYAAAQLTLIGEGPERTALENRVKEHGLTLGPGQAVEMPGTTTDPSEELRRADLFVLPSREEGMSIALLEAMALGTPLVASRIAGNARLVSDFKHGRLSLPDNPDHLARVIIDQWDNFDSAIEMGHAARSRVEAEFSIQTVARKHLELFRSLVVRY
jgi:glycosyltransferase involved in cell wall biosynthesis